MNWEAIGAVSELIAAAGVIASMFYVGYRIRQNTVHSRAYTQRDILTEITRDHLVGGDKAALYRKALSDFSLLNNDEKVEANAILITLINRFEATLRLHNTGLVDEALFRGHRAFILGHILTKGGKEWWSILKHGFSEDVTGYLDNAISENIDLPLPFTTTVPFFSTEQDE